MLINEYVIFDVDKFKESGYDVSGKLTKYNKISSTSQTPLAQYLKALGFDYDREFQKKNYPVFRTKKFLPQDYVQNNKDVIMQIPVTFAVLTKYVVDFSEKVYQTMIDEEYKVDGRFAYNIREKFGHNPKTEIREIYDPDRYGYDTMSHLLSSLQIDSSHKGTACSCVWTDVVGIRKEDGNELFDWMYDNEGEYDREKRTDCRELQMYFEVFNEDGIQVYDSSINNFYYDNFEDLESAAWSIMSDFESEESKLEQEFEDYFAKDYYYEITCLEEMTSSFQLGIMRNFTEYIRVNDKGWDVVQIVRDNM